MQNPSPTLEQIEALIKSLPEEQQQIAYKVFTMTMNACFVLAETD